MVDVTLIKDTINELLEANVDKETIHQTLRDIGVEQADIDKYYKEATANKTEAKDPAKEEPTTKNKENNAPEQSVASLKKEETPRTPKTPRPVPKTTTEELQKATEDISDSEDLSENEKEEPIVITKTIEVNNTNSEIKKQLSELETQITDIKAQINGLTKIMKDILEENRNILNRLK